MNSQLSADTHRILSGLAQLNGAAGLSVVARVYPRVAPRDGGMLHQLHYEFTCDRLPETVPVPEETDEVTITLRGVPGSEVTKPQLKSAVDDLLAMSAAQNSWDARVYFGSENQKRLGYQIKVFNTQACWQTC
jgi:hypothetical protein